MQPCTQRPPLTLLYSNYRDIMKKPRQRSGNRRENAPPPVLGELRNMAIATASTKLARFNESMKKTLHTRTTVDTVQILRDNSVTADHFLTIADRGMPQLRDARPSRIQRLRSMVHGAPKLREVLKQIATYVLPPAGTDVNKSRFQKLLITEEYPLIAWMWELVLNFLHIPTQVLHSSLSEAEREHVVSAFKEVPQNGDLSHLSVMILMYTINATGVNLDEDCNRVIVNTAASSTPLEVQAWSRVVRVSNQAAGLHCSGSKLTMKKVSQKKKVNITRLCTENSHDEWRDSVQAGKTLLDAACKSYDDKTMRTMVNILNDFGQKEIEYIQDCTELGRARRNVHLRKMKSGERDEEAGGSSGDSKAADDVDNEEAALGYRNPHTHNAPAIERGHGGVEEDDSDEDDEDENDEDYNNEGEDEDEILENESDHPGEEDDDTVGDSTPVQRKQRASRKVTSYMDDDVRDQRLNDALLSPVQEGRFAEDDAEDDYTLSDGASEEDEQDSDTNSIEQELAELKSSKRHAKGKKSVKSMTKSKPTEPDVPLDPLEDDIDWKQGSSLLHGFNKDYKDATMEKDQTDIYYCYIATLDRTHVYSKYELENSPLVLERALRLLHRIRYGQFEANLRVTPYLNYSALGGDLARKIANRIKKECKEGRQLDPAMIEYLTRAQNKVRPISYADLHISDPLTV